jgi:hypothetical protein
MAVVLRGEHPLDFNDEHCVALARPLDERAAFVRRALQSQLEDLANLAEVVRRHGADGGSVVHKHPLTYVAEFPWGAYHAPAGDTLIP